jgi:flagellar basal-body rod modification protein FlgD
MAIPAIIAPAAAGVASSLVQSAVGSATAAAGSVLGKDDFLKLMLAQLKNQDPMNPMQSTDFIAQTAQFTSLEQLQNMNKLLEQMTTQSGVTSAAGAAALLGKTVSVNGSPIQFDGLQQLQLPYALPVGGAAVGLQITDASGKVVRTMNLGAQAAGTHRVVFDGLGDDGQALPAGSYQYQVGAANASGQAVPGIVTGSGVVTGIAVDSGVLMLVIGNQHVPLSSMVGVGGQSL